LLNSTEKYFSTLLYIYGRILRCQNLEKKLKNNMNSENQSTEIVVFISLSQPIYDYIV